MLTHLEIPSSDIAEVEVRMLLELYTRVLKK
jgi:hypothetical protein